MEVTIKYFGSLAEVTRCEEENLFFSGSYISELLDFLYTKYSGLKDKEFQVAQNTELVSLIDKLTGNQIVLLPPFAGG
ncbi:MoaD/ThiS family protein [Salinimicrobium flavum]|uniref:MoaD/ThiS family protein n=1 Tax=Salinimicrobium flavum TaxID=1737065 RepID=A0ABW5IVS8_9FLAO